MAPDKFSWSLDHRGGEVVLAMRGDLDLASEPDAQSAVAAAEGAAGPCLVIDVSAVTFMGSCGVRLLLEAAKRAGSDDREMVLIPGPAAEKVLALTDLTHRFKFRSV